MIESVGSSWFVKTTLNISGIHAVERFHFNNRLYYYVIQSTFHISIEATVGRLQQSIQRCKFETNYAVRSRLLKNYSRINTLNVSSLFIDNDSLIIAANKGEIQIKWDEVEIWPGHYSCDRHRNP